MTHTPPRTAARVFFSRPVRVLVPSVLICSLLGATSCDFSSGEASAPSPGDGAEPASAPVEEAAVLVRLGDWEVGAVDQRLAVAADLEAIREADVLPEISGVVREVFLEEGKWVEAGQAVVQLVDDELRLTHENKRILHEQAATKVRAADLAVVEARSLLDQKKLLLDEAESDFERLLDLAVPDGKSRDAIIELRREADAIEDHIREVAESSSADELRSLRRTEKEADDRYRAALRAAIGQTGLSSFEEVEAKRYARARAAGELRSTELQIGKSSLAVTEAQQAESLAKVEMDSAALALARTTIRAPISGHITRLDVKPGEHLSTTTLAFHVVDVVTLRARLHVPQRELRRLIVGQDVVLRTEVYPGEEFPGVVETINPVIGEQGMVSVLVAVEENDKLRPGLFVSGDIIVDVRDDAVLVSKRAIWSRTQKAVLFLVRGDIAHRYELVTGYSTEDAIEVLGLIAMDGRRVSGARAALDDEGRLVLVGHNGLEEGAKVDVEEPSRVTVDGRERGVREAEAAPGDEASGSAPADDAPEAVGGSAEVESASTDDADLDEETSGDEIDSTSREVERGADGDR